MKSKRKSRQRAPQRRTTHSALPFLSNFIKYTRNRPFSQPVFHFWADSPNLLSFFRVSLPCGTFCRRILKSGRWRTIIVPILWIVILEGDLWSIWIILPTRRSIPGCWNASARSNAGASATQTLIIRPELPPRQRSTRPPSASRSCSACSPQRSSIRPAPASPTTLRSRGWRGSPAMWASISSRLRWNIRRSAGR